MTDSLLHVNVNDKTEKKGNLTYLSWAWAWAEVLKHDPGATWFVHTYGPPGSDQPCMWIGETAMVHTSVVIKGLSRSCMLPVMDHKNNALKNPDARKISDAIMRCMTKAISMHGLGLYIYAGEDLPEPEAGEHTPPSLVPVLQASIDAAKAKRTGVMADVLASLPPLSREDALYYDELAHNVSKATGPGVALALIDAERLDSEQKLHLWSRLDSKVRSGLKAEQAKQDFQPTKASA